MHHGGWIKGALVMALGGVSVGRKVMVHFGELNHNDILVWHTGVGFEGVSFLPVRKLSLERQGP